MEFFNLDQMMQDCPQEPEMTDNYHIEVLKSFIVNDLKERARNAITSQQARSNQVIGLVNQGIQNIGSTDQNQINSCVQNPEIAGQQNFMFWDLNMKPFKSIFQVLMNMQIRYN